MTSLLYVGNYEECYELASRQILILESLDINDHTMKLAKKGLLVASIGCEKYEKVLELLQIKDELNLTEITCLMIAYYNTNRKEYESYFKYGINYDKSEKVFLKYINTLNNFIKKPNKKYLEILENSEIMAPMKKIFKKMLSA